MMTIPNLLTLSRLLVLPLIIGLLFTSSPKLILTGAFISLAAAITDAVDGYIARKYPQQRSELGTRLDPLVDKVFILSLYFTFWGLGLLPLWLVLVVLFRELLVSVIRQVRSRPGQPVGANWMGKSKFILQTINIIHLHLVYGCGLTGAPLIFFSQPAGLYLTLVVTVISLAYAANFLWWCQQRRI